MVCELLDSRDAALLIEHLGLRYLRPVLMELLLASAGYWCLAVEQLLFSDCMVHLCFFHTSPLHPKAYNPLLLVTFWLKRESTMHCLQMIIVPVSTYCCAAECLSCKRCICTTIFSSHLCKQFAAAFVCLLVSRETPNCDHTTITTSTTTRILQGLFCICECRLSATFVRHSIVSICLYFDNGKGKTLVSYLKQTGGYFFQLTQTPWQRRGSSN